MDGSATFTMVLSIATISRLIQQIASTSYRPFETMIGSALVFLVINLVISLSGRVAESRFAAARA